MSKHTPGPWQYAFEGGTVAFITEADGTTVCKLSTLENSTAHSRLAANARLIAAAPALLEALYAIKLCEFNSMSSRHEMLRLAQQAIERAVGTTD